MVMRNRNRGPPAVLLAPAPDVSGDVQHGDFSKKCREDGDEAVVAHMRLTGPEVNLVGVKATS